MRRILVALLILGISGFSRARPQGPGCSFGLNEHLPKKNEPLLLVGSGKTLSLAMPKRTSDKHGSVDLKPGEELTVACPGKGNFLQVTNEASTPGQCQRGDTVTIGSTELSVQQLDCKNRVAASLSDTGIRCLGGKGTIVEIGFKVDKWFKLIDACHNKEESLSYYTTHKVYGTSLSGKVIQSYRPGFSRGDKEFFKGLDPNEIYNEKHQEKVFEELFGSKKTATYMDRKKSFFLARGHLAPDADFLFGTWQLLTYFYINAAPQWQSINAGNWLSVENNVRKLAIAIGADLDVTTGTHGVLKLKDDKGTLQEIYLGGKGRVPVPELYWKIVYNPKDKSCIAIVSTNNPFLDKAPNTICTDVCAKHHWPVLQSERNKGYIYCCDYKEFKDAVKNVPNYKCSSILKFK